MDNLLKLLIDFHLANERQGPGHTNFTKKALDFITFDSTKELQIADLGCGCGAQSLDIAEELKGHLHAVDLSTVFLKELECRAKKRKLKAKVETLEADMNQLPFEKESLDLIWAESSIYNIGFKRGLNLWQSFLKPGGYMVISELSWMRDNRPHPLNEHWKLEYPGIQNIAGNIQTIFDQNLESLAHYCIDEKAWMENYYEPLQEGFEDFLKRNNYGPEAQSIVEGELAEIALYKKYKDYFNYVFYVIRKPLA